MRRVVVIRKIMQTVTAILMVTLVVLVMHRPDIPRPLLSYNCSIMGPRLSIPHAMHSPLMAPILPELRKAMQAVKRLSCKTRHSYNSSGNKFACLFLFICWPVVLLSILFLQRPGPSKLRYVSDLTTPAGRVCTQSLKPGKP